MKKLILIAVMAAFSAPAFAATGKVEKPDCAQIKQLIEQEKQAAQKDTQDKQNQENREGK
jgi:hypothetical protein